MVVPVRMQVHTTLLRVANKKQVETNPQDFVDLCFKFGLKNITVLEVVTPEQPTVEMHQADILIKALDNGREVLVHFEFSNYR